MVCFNTDRRVAVRADLQRCLEQMSRLLKDGRYQALSQMAEALAILAGREDRASLVRPVARLLGAAEREDALGCVTALVAVAQAMDEATE
jgi:hypothetical protein